MRVCMCSCVWVGFWLMNERKSLPVAAFDGADSYRQVAADKHI